MMSADENSVLAIERIYSQAGHDPGFSEILAVMRSNDDTVLAELIEADGRHRIANGEPVRLQRYLEEIPDLRERQDPLDAAVDVALRSASGGSHITMAAVEQLTREFPELRETILEVTRLNSMMLPTAQTRARVAPTPHKNLPCDFGPVTPAGEQRYQLQKLLGEGGFGQVYLALDRQLSEEGHTALVAIKILASGKRSPWARERLIEEATKVRRISHPNVVTVIDRGVTERDEDYIVYEFVDGGDLGSFIKSAAPMSPRDAAAIMEKIARGVHAAHAAGVIHCDLKPGNIMVNSVREPKVADFGIAVRQSDGVMKSELGIARSESWAGPIGNVAFISPEQYRGEDQGFSVQSDVYALGGILFWMLTGELPNGSTLEQIARTHDARHGRAQPPSARALKRGIGRDLDAICRRALASNPADRYSSAAMLADDLQRWLRQEPIPWTHPSGTRIVYLWARRKPALAAAVFAILLCILAGTWAAEHYAGLAREKSLEAKISKFEADEQELKHAQQKAIADKFTKGLKAALGDYRFATESLTYIWAMEYVFGPKVLALPDQQAALWKTRIENIRTLVKSAELDGHGNDLETMIWESALGFWLVNAKDFNESEAVLRSNIEKWSRILSPDDPWLSDLHMLLKCAEVNRMLAQAKQKETVAAADLSRMEAELLDECRRFPKSRYGTPLHFTLITSMMDLYGPELLNHPQRYQQLRASYAALVAKKPVEAICQ